MTEFCFFTLMWYGKVYVKSIMYLSIAEHKVQQTAFNPKSDNSEVPTIRRLRQVQWGFVLRRFVLLRFTFTTLVESDPALPTCSASLSQLKRLFST